MKRDDPIVRANRAAQVLENAEFQEAFATYRERVVGEMERLELDGSNSEQAAALVQKLQAALGFKAEFVRLLQSGDRAEKRTERDDAEKPFDPTALPQPKGEK